VPDGIKGVVDHPTIQEAYEGQVGRINKQIAYHQLGSNWYALSYFDGGYIDLVR